MADLTLTIDTDELQSEINDMVESAVGNVDPDLDFSSAVDSAVASADFDDKVSDAVDDADFEYALKVALKRVDLSDAVTRTFKNAAVRAQLGDFVAHVIKRAMAINFGMVTEETHLDDVAGMKEENARLNAELRALKDKQEAESISASFGETVPAFDESPLGAGMQPKPYVSVDPEALLEKEDDEATEAFLLAKSLTAFPRTGRNT